MSPVDKIAWKEEGLRNLLGQTERPITRWRDAFPLWKACFQRHYYVNYHYPSCPETHILAWYYQEGNLSFFQGRLEQGHLFYQMAERYRLKHFGPDFKHPQR